MITCTVPFIRNCSNQMWRSGDQIQQPRTVQGRPGPILLFRTGKKTSWKIYKFEKYNISENSNLPNCEVDKMQVYQIAKLIKCKSTKCNLDKMLYGMALLGHCTLATYIMIVK